MTLTENRKVVSDTLFNGEITLFGNLQLNLRLSIFAFLQIHHNLNRGIARVIRSPPFNTTQPTIQYFLVYLTPT